MRRLLPLVALLILLACGLLAAGCGGGETAEPLPETVEGTIQQETVGEGDAEAGGALFAEEGCGGCHTYGPAGSNAEIGPSLDEALQGDDAATIRSSIINPNAEITEGFGPDIMPADYGEQFDDEQIANLVAFLQQ